LCHTGLVWKSTLGGRTLHFHLAGINNQNFIMRDEETGSWWQQITGCARFGPLAGQCLEACPWDEVSFTIWKEEHPRTRVLRPDDRMKGDYASADWEKEIAELPTVAPGDPQDDLKPRDLVVGVTLGSEATAYPVAALTATNAILDEVGETPVLILLHPDGGSLRCFDRRVDGGALNLFLRTDTNLTELLDTRTGSTWGFSGLATAGPLSGRRLARIPCLKDFWFDWKAYHANTRVYGGGDAAPEK